MSNKFQLGRTVATPGALAALQVVGIAPSTLLHRHQQGDSVDVSERDAKQNEIALLYGSRILSARSLLRALTDTEIASQRAYCCRLNTDHTASLKALALDSAWAFHCHLLRAH